MYSIGIGLVIVVCCVVMYFKMDSITDKYTVDSYSLDMKGSPYRILVSDREGNQQVFFRSDYIE